MSNLAGGLRHLLAGKRVSEVTILPGFVDTPMIAPLPKEPLWAVPEAVVADSDRARGFGAVYTLWLWRWIMLLIKHVPERLFVRTRL